LHISIDGKEVTTLGLFALVPEKGNSRETYNCKIVYLDIYRVEEIKDVELTFSTQSDNTKHSAHNQTLLKFKTRQQSKH
jgi:hypothetical protein